jgi:hypothetical protein
MSWVASAVIGGASVVGAGIGAYSSGRAADKASDATRYAADTASQTQWDMYDQTRRDNMQFLAPAGRSLATLQSALYGGQFGYDTPGYKQLSSDDLAGLDNPSQYDPNQTWFRGEGGDIVNAVPQMQAQWQPQESEGFKYTKSRTLEDLGRQLRMMGRGSGTVAANSFGRTLGDLNAGNEATQRNELWNMVKTGQGAAGSITGAGTNAANNVSNNTMSAGNTLANINLNNGNTQANLWGGLGGTAANAYGTYQMGQYLKGK